jgi:alpha-tubulin suppressor-like RCC1 family protein
MKYLILFTLTTILSVTNTLSASTTPTVSGGGYHSLALKSDGMVWSWGRNNYGQLGNGKRSKKNTPILVKNLNDVIAIAGGTWHSLALKQDGTVWAWGRNDYGQLGDGTFRNKKTPVEVKDLADVVAIAGGHLHSLALKSDGTVWAWGSNWGGQLGNETVATVSNIPVQVNSLQNISFIACGSSHNLAIRTSDGVVWTWGDNSNGQLGNGTYASQNTPVLIEGLEDVASIGTGWLHSLAIKSDGTVWAWGDNRFGQLGDGTYKDSKEPIQTKDLNTLSGD